MRKGLALAAGVATAGLLLSSCSWRMAPLPELAPVAPETTRIFTANGQLLTTVHGVQDREVVPLSRIPKVLVDAIVDIEDARFWEHTGIDVKAVLRALRNNASGGGVQGASTITQQYVKSLNGNPPRTAKEKLREATQAVQLEQRLTKERILELYLNTIYFGNGAYGVQAAAREYFGVDVDKLDLSQAAMLAGVIHSPGADDPFVHPEVALARRNVVLDTMTRLGSITPQAAALAQLAAPNLHIHSDEPHYGAPYFVEQVKQFILNDPRFGATPDARRDLLYNGGLRITTTLDLAAQQQAEWAIDAVLPKGADQPDAALVSIEPSTGFVRVLVGGRDFFGTDPQAKFDLAVQGKRQAGSSFKPFVLATALQQGMPLYTPFDAPSHIDIALPRGSNPPVWSVDNAENEASGQINLIDATVHSVNTVYAQLVMQVGPANAVAMANRLGITSTLQAVPSMTLGSNDVSPLEMASAYGSFATGGMHATPTFVTLVTKRDGTILYRFEPHVTRVLDRKIAATETAVLQQVIARGTGRAAGIGRPVAGKTGTAEDLHDAWFVGYTRELSTAVWVGFAQAQKSMYPPATRIAVFGGTWPAQIWGQFMRGALANVPPSSFDAPEPITMMPTPPTTAPPVTLPVVPT